MQPSEPNSQPLPTTSRKSRTEKTKFTYNKSQQHSVPIFIYILSLGRASFASTGKIAEGATAPEPLRQKDRRETQSWKAKGNLPPKGKAAVSRSSQVPKQRGQLRLFAVPASYLESHEVVPFGVSTGSFRASSHEQRCRIFATHVVCSWRGEP